MLTHSANPDWATVGSRMRTYGVSELKPSMALGLDAPVGDGWLKQLATSGVGERERAGGSADSVAACFRLQDLAASADFPFGTAHAMREVGRPSLSAYRGAGMPFAGPRSPTAFCPRCNRAADSTSSAP